MHARLPNSLKESQSERQANATTSDPELENIDVAIVGGGPAGFALACALSSSPSVRETLRVALVEGGDLSRRFLPTGPITFLPLSPTTSSLVWSTKPPLAAALLPSDPTVVATMINAAFRLPEISLRYLHSPFFEAQAAGSKVTGPSILDEVKWRERSHAIDSQSAYSSCEPEAANVGIPPLDADMLPPLVASIQTGSMASFPIRFNHADAYAGEGTGGRTVLVGDAAYTVHPLAGKD